MELVVVLALMTLLAAAVSAAFVAGLDNERALARRRQQVGSLRATEQRLSRMLEGARITDDATDRTTYFIGDNSDGSEGGDADLGCDRLTFTTTGAGVPMALRTNADDFETQHQAQGPVGGLAEAAYSTTPSSADAPEDAQGLFERLQRPSDGDTTQGGTEALLDGQIERIGFQFWDGTQWVTAWDTVNGSEGRRLPAAVKVSYTLRGEEGAEGTGEIRSFVVAVPASDVDAQNPVTTGGTVTGGANGAGGTGGAAGAGQ